MSVDEDVKMEIKDEEKDKDVTMAAAPVDPASEMRYWRKKVDQLEAETKDLRARLTEAELAYDEHKVSEFVCGLAWFRSWLLLC